MAKSKAQQAAIAISMKKAGKKPALKKAKDGIGIGPGPGGTAAKSNIGEKIAAGIGAGMAAIGTALTVAKAKRAKKQAANVKSDIEKEVAEKGRYGGTKMKSGGKVPSGYHKMPDGKIMKNSAHKKK